ncbi:MAG: alpha/beta hydrolase [Thermoguttaceae bacterium]
MRVKTFYLRSGRLSESRGVTVFRPDGLPSLDRANVVYCADGASVERLAPFVAAAIKSKRISPVVLVGVHNSQMHRAEEYLLGVRPELFEAHEQFFTIEVPQWLRNDFGLSTTRECSGVFGYSNGGAFVMAMGRRHREQFGVVISFSAPRTAQPVPKSEYLLRPVPRHYLAAGTREFGIRKNMLALSQMLEKQGVDCLYSERDAGHDFCFWADELPRALQWAFCEPLE